MGKYYYYDTSGADTNLQLYSLKQAKKYWSDLVKDVENDTCVSDFQERCVFVVNTMGVSISQLLGQSNPSPAERVPSPKTLFDSIVDTNGLDPELKVRFKEFIDAYDHCRHFGVTLGQQRHWEVDQITLEKTKRVYDFGLEIWGIVIDTFKRNSSNELDDLEIENIENMP